MSERPDDEVGLPAESARRAILSDPEWRAYAAPRGLPRPLRVLGLPLRVARALRTREAGLDDRYLDAPAPPVPIRAPALPADPAAVRGVAAALRAQRPDEVRALVARAERILAGEAPVGTRRARALGFPPDWRASLPDSEQGFYLHRLYSVLALAKAAALTGDGRYAAGVGRLVADWAARNPPAGGAPVWESYSVAERIGNLLLAEALLAGSDAGAIPGLDALLAEHGAWLVRHLERRPIHNHLINDARALFLLGCARPGLPVADEARARGWQILLTEARQFDADGFFGEQSTHYHLLVSARYAECALVARRAGVPVPQALEELLARAFRLAAAFVRQDGSLVTVGDVSPDLDPAAAPGLAALGAAFGASPPCPPGESACWTLGHVPDARREPLDGLVSLPASGIVVSRRADEHLLARCDPAARAVRHGHQDVLSLDWHAGGRHLLVDPGCSSFRADAWERYFRGPRAHSTVVLDGLPPFVRSSLVRTALPREHTAAAAGVVLAQAAAGAAEIHLEHTGYRRLGAPGLVRRRVRHTAGSLDVEDEVQCAGRHRLEILWQLGGDEVRVTGRSATVTSAEGDVVARLEVTTDLPARLEARRAATAPPAGWSSPAYGLVAASNTLIMESPIRDRASVRTRLTLGRA